MSSGALPEKLGDAQGLDNLGRAIDDFDTALTGLSDADRLLIMGDGAAE